MNDRGQLGGFTRDDSLPGQEDRDTPEWHYAQNGSRNGQFTAAQLRSLLASNDIGPETLVWRPGFSDWKALRFTEIGEESRSLPPPLASQYVGNGIVWTLAFLPLIYGIIDASIDYENQRAFARTLTLGFDYKKIPSMPMAIPFAINSLLCLWDDRRLKRAGYNSRWMVLTAIILVPVYLFMRARLLKQ